jgi:hypothetical protein
MADDEWPDEVPSEAEARVQKLLAELLDTDALDDIPGLEPLVADTLFLDTLTRLYGPSGTFKSFLTLSLAGSVGTGLPWFNNAVRQGQVVYLVAEGAKGIRKRVRAWEKHHGVSMTGVKFLPRPVQVRSPEWAVLKEACRRLKAVLIIIDTQARVTVGVNENDNTEMGVVLDLMEQLRSATGACVLVVHHSGHENADRGRGASAVKGGMQTELGVSRAGKGIPGTRITLTTGKQKDDEEQAPQVFRLRQVAIDGETKDDGSPVTSIVLVPANVKDAKGEPEEGSPEWIVRQLDAANVPTNWGNPRVIKACAELKIKARKEKIEEAVKIRKNRTNQVPPNLPRDLEEEPSPESGEGEDLFAGQTFPRKVGGRSGNGITDTPSPVPAPKGGGRSDAPRGKDGPIALCEVCLRTMTKLTPDQTRHRGCRVAA